MPRLVVTQWCQSWPADDDGVWRFDLTGHPFEHGYPRALVQCVQVESPTGQVPFMVETAELCCEEARKGNSAAEIVSMIINYMEGRNGA
jgi:hypothetical protein